MSQLPGGGGVTTTGGGVTTTGGGVTTTGGGVTTALTPFDTVWPLNDAACPPSGVCKGFEEGFVYAIVTMSPFTTGVASVTITLVPETETELIDLAAEFTMTENAETAGTVLASARLYVISITAGAALSTAAPEKTGTAGGAGAFILFVTVWAPIEAACPPAAVCRGLAEGFV